MLGRGARRLAGLVIAVVVVTGLAGVALASRGDPPRPEVIAAHESVTAGPPASTPAPAACEDGVRVGPEDDLARLAAEHPPGTTFCLGPGVHRHVELTPRDGQRFIGVGARTVLSGARVLEAADARREGDRWYWSGQTQTSDPHGELLDPEFGGTNPGDRYNEELFVTPADRPDAAPRRLTRVLSLDELRPGRWFLDDDADRIWVAEDPAGLGLIETSVTRFAIHAPESDRVERVVIENLVVEKYASPAQQGVLGGPGAVDWDIRFVTVRDGHGTGIDMGPGTLVEYSRIHRMGHQGLTGGGEARNRPTTLRWTEVADNGLLGFDPEWERGGAKFARAFARGFLVEQCWFHGNQGHGLWFDIDNFNVVVRSSLFERNDRSGIFYEVSRDARIYWNVVRGATNGPENHTFSGAGIAVSNSGGVDIFENVVHDNDHGIVIRQDPKATRWAQDTYRNGLPQVANVNILRNDIQMRRGLTGVFIEGDLPDRYRQSLNVRFDDNTYRIDRVRRQFMGSGNDLYTFDEWRRQGNDRASRALPSGSTGRLPANAVPFRRLASYGATD